MFAWRKRVEAKLDKILKSIDVLNQGTLEELQSMSALDDAIAQLQADVTADTNVDSAALTLIGGIPKMISDAVATALANGATPAQLASLTALSKTLEANAGSLSAAVAAGTPAAVPAPTAAHPGA